ncbi:MAG: WYL domain-containing protein [Akkermansiaceae bacterium]|nr:WYL domain-containing protein [Akkermansiaceae bacterium]
MAFIRDARAGATRRPMQRIYVIHEAVLEGTYPNCRTLAERLEVTDKTIQRDITFMRDELQLPLEYDDKVHGYSYSQDVSDFPVFELGAAELAGLFLARHALDAVRGTGLEETMREVFTKLTKMIEGQVQFSWSEMDRAFSRKTPGVAKADLKLFGRLAEALLQRHEIGFHYRKLGAEAAEARRIQPYHLGEVDGCWYVIGMDLDREALRTFALPRLSRLKVGKTRFELPDDFDGTNYLRHSFGVWTAASEEALHIVRVELRDYAARMAQERRWHPTQELKVLNNAGTRVELCFHVSRLEEMVRWVLSWGSKAKVLGPPELKKMVRDEVKEMG